MNNLSYHPLVSVIIPCKDAEQTIGITLSSLLSQTYQNYEVIIINDGSNDSTLDVINELHTPRIKVIVNKISMGPSASRNIAISLSNGEILSFLDADDFWSPFYLEKVVSCFSQNSEIDVVYACFIKNKCSSLRGKKIYADVLDQGYLFAPSVVSIKASFIKKFNLFWDATYVHSEDDVFSFEVAKYAWIEQIHEPLVYYGAGPNNISSNTLKRAEGYFKLFSAYRDDIIENCGARTYAKHLFFVSQNYAGAGKLSNAMGIYIKSLFGYHLFGDSRYPNTSVSAFNAIKNIIFYGLGGLYRSMRGSQ